jgi:hypothetical protein
LRSYDILTAREHCGPSVGEGEVSRDEPHLIGTQIVVTEDVEGPEIARWKDRPQNPYSVDRVFLDGRMQPAMQQLLGKFTVHERSESARLGQFC